MSCNDTSFIILSIATFTLSMSGTFLVRSGILNSVHTFENDPEKGLFILTFLFILIFISLLNFFLFHKTDNIRFKTGYENRRINVTMLFGNRLRK